MYQTLFYIPHYWFEGPLLWAWLLLGAVYLGIQIWRFGWSKDTLSFLPVYIIGAVLIYWLLPKLEVTDISATDPTGPEEPIGLAIRGYGFMMLLGLVSGVALSIIRGRQVGIHPDRIISMAFWLVICGIIGARLFYVIQKRDQFDAGTPLELIGSMLNMTQGGLVVYGSLIGGMIGGLVFVRLHKMPTLTVADVIAPGMVIGLAIGRIGCLMNGCCFGGPCDIPQIAQQFPAGSPPYLRQLETGELLGIRRRVEGQGEQKLTIAEVIEPGSIAQRYGVKQGEPFLVMFPTDKYFRAIKTRNIKMDSYILVVSGETQIQIPIEQLQERSLPVFPVQIFSAINAALLSGVLWFYFPLRRHDGQVFALMLVLYAISRFLLEYIRQDEFGFMGTPFTISQWVSFGMLLMGFAVFAIAGVVDGRDGQKKTHPS